MNQANILIVGAGRMAEAIISGLVKKQGTTGKITVTNRSDIEKLERLQHTYKIQTSDDWESEIEHHEVILLASPPQTHEEQLNILKNKISNQLIITVAAGIDPTYMEKRLPTGTPVCWIMPNTAAQIGKSISTYVCGQYVTKDHRLIIETILSAIGESEELTEQQVHDLTAITGSAPAFVYSFVQALEHAAIENGVTKEQARTLVSKMVSGSAAMLEAGYEPSDLISQVASPGGSTAEGLKVFEKEGFQKIVEKAVQATNEHARGNG
ncbi:pyrroline-5-carboxylate reductase [Evansella sp. AB-rgal1]|uniref:pyrroline-5-carboxylate reductase n=1 Tax=Evansella sp. AB-rgal1 TaxID=3242696 RepID=UPI00359DC32F